MRMRLPAHALIPLAARSGKGVAWLKARGNRGFWGDFGMREERGEIWG